MSTMPRSAGERPVSVVVDATVEPGFGVTDSLYAVAALVGQPAVALLVVRDRAASLAGAERLAARLEGLLPIRILTVDGAAAHRTGAAGAGVAAALTPYCCLLTVSDILYPRFGHLLAGALDANPDAPAAHGAALCSRGTLLDGDYLTVARAPWSAPGRPPGDRSVALPATLIRTAAARAALAALGPGDGRDDFESRMLAELAARGRLLEVEVVVAERRSVLAGARPGRRSGRRRLSTVRRRLLGSAGD